MYSFYDTKIIFESLIDKPIKLNIMKKLILSLVFAVALIACGEADKPVNVNGDWKFKEHVEGTMNMNPQNEAMINSIVKLFKDVTI